MQPLGRRVRLAENRRETFFKEPIAGVGEPIDGVPAAWLTGRDRSDLVISPGGYTR